MAVTSLAWLSFFCRRQSSIVLASKIRRSSISMAALKSKKSIVEFNLRVQTSTPNSVDRRNNDLETMDEADDDVTDDTDVDMDKVKEQVDDAAAGQQDGAQFGISEKADSEPSTSGIRASRAFASKESVVSQKENNPPTIANKTSKASKESLHSEDEVETAATKCTETEVASPQQTRMTRASRAFASKESINSENNEILENAVRKTRASKASASKESVAIASKDLDNETPENALRKTRASKASASKESVAIASKDSDNEITKNNPTEAPVKPSRKRSSKTLNRAQDNNVKDEAMPHVQEAVEEKSSRKTKSSRNRLSPEQIESAAQEEINVATPSPPTKVSKIAEAEVAVETKPLSKPKPRFARARAEAEESQRRAPLANAALYANRAVFSGGVGSGSSSSSHFKHRYAVSIKFNFP